MVQPNVGFSPLATTSKDVARRLLTIGENRIELLRLEVQEETEHLLHAFLMALGVAVFGLLAGLALTAALVVLLWPYAPLATLLTLTGIYATAGFCLWWRLIALVKDWQTLSATLEQLRKDRACLEKLLA